jgi:hypothetical protein
MSSGTFSTFSKFHLNISKSTNMKVVQFVEGHNFHVGWHFQFWVEKGGNLGQLPVPPVHWHRLKSRATRLPVVALYVRRARGGPLVHPRSGCTPAGWGAQLHGGIFATDVMATRGAYLSTACPFPRATPSRPAAIAALSPSSPAR